MASIHPLSTIPKQYIPFIVDIMRRLQARFVAWRYFDYGLASEAAFDINGEYLVTRIQWVEESDGYFYQVDVLGARRILTRSYPIKAY
jgi:hypothetical protein